jgi:hypothetical protein
VIWPGDRFSGDIEKPVRGLVNYQRLGSPSGALASPRRCRMPVNTLDPPPARRPPLDDPRHLVCARVGDADGAANRAFMVAGLALQGTGRGWVAAIAAPGMDYAQMGIAGAVAGLAISLVFPVVANAVLSSVPPDEAGVASGTNSTMRELGGVFGVAVRAAAPVPRHECAIAGRGVGGDPGVRYRCLDPALYVRDLTLDGGRADARLGREGQDRYQWCAVAPVPECSGDLRVGLVALAAGNRELV